MNAKRGIIVLGLLSAVSIPTWAQQIKGVVIDQKSKEIAKVSQTSIFFNLKLYKKELEEDISYFAYMFQKDAYLSSERVCHKSVTHPFFLCVSVYSS